MALMMATKRVAVTSGEKVCDWWGDEDAGKHGSDGGDECHGDDGKGGGWTMGLL